jgi:hypothetical protein
MYGLGSQGRKNLGGRPLGETATRLDSRQEQVASSVSPPFCRLDFPDFSPVEDERANAGFLAR